jgi:hypothetical protein
MNTEEREQLFIGESFLNIMNKQKMGVKTLTDNKWTLEDKVLKIHTEIAGSNKKGLEVQTYEYMGVWDDSGDIFALQVKTDDGIYILFLRKSNQIKEEDKIDWPESWLKLSMKNIELEKENKKLKEENEKHFFLWGSRKSGKTWFKADIFEKIKTKTRNKANTRMHEGLERLRSQEEHCSKENNCDDCHHKRICYK